MYKQMKTPPVRYAAAVEEDMYDEDDGLGYYSDGEKRTLTDEQIAIFRHSELQGFLKRIAAGELEVNLPINQPRPPAENVDQSIDVEVDVDADNSESMDISLDTSPSKTEAAVVLEGSPKPSAGQGQAQKKVSKRNSRRWKKLKQRHQAMQAEQLEERIMGERHDPTEFVDEDLSDHRTFRRKARELDDQAAAQSAVFIEYD